MQKQKKAKILTVFLVLLLFAIPVKATVDVKQDAVFKSGSNDAEFTMGSNFTFYKVEVNSTHLWLDKTYSLKHYTRYCIYVTSPDNCSFTVDSWFATANSTAQLTIDSPLSTTINLGFYSPNLISASAMGVVSQTWHSANQTLLMTANSDTSSIIVISATVNETEQVNIPPENYDVEITDMEGCGNWVFSEESYYTFQARYWDGDGYSDLDTVKIAFTDGVTWVNASYDVSEGTYSLDSGEDVVNLQFGTVTIQDPNLLQVTFLFYFENDILDAYDVDIYLWCNDTTGETDSWEIKATDYFNIYNLGGHSTLTYNGTAGRLVGGDVFDLYAYNNSWVDSSMIFRDLQHIKLLPIIALEFKESLTNFSVKYYMDYCVNDVWTEGWALVIESPLGAYWGKYDTNNAYMNWTVKWYNRGEFVTTQQMYSFLHFSSEYTNVTSRLWIDLWFNKENASSVLGGRVNAYYFPMENDANEWLRWLTGNNWGIDEDKRKQSMFFETLLDESNNTLYTKQIDLVRVGCRLETGYDGVESVYAQVAEYDVFDLTLGGTPLEGTQTPVFDETKEPRMPQGGFLGTVVSAFGGFVRWLGNILSRGALALWDFYVAFVDTIFTAFGYPNVIDLAYEYLQTFWAWFQVSFTYLFGILTPVFTFLSLTLGKALNTLSILITQWVAMIQVFFNFLGGTYTAGINVWNDLGFPNWILLGAIVFYPLWLLAKFEEDGLDAVINHFKMMLDIGAWVMNIVLNVIRLFLNLIGRIIESIPVVE